MFEKPISIFLGIGVSDVAHGIIFTTWYVLIQFLRIIYVSLLINISFVLSVK